jgi:hypothetical protein
MALVGHRLDDCLVGEADAMQLIFSMPGREMASAIYGQSPIDTAWIDQLEHFFRFLFVELPSDGPIKSWKWALELVVRRRR